MFHFSPCLVVNSVLKQKRSWCTALDIGLQGFLSRSSQFFLPSNNHFNRSPLSEHFFYSRNKIGTVHVSTLSLLSSTLQRIHDLPFYRQGDWELGKLHWFVQDDPASCERLGRGILIWACLTSKSISFQLAIMGWEIRLQTCQDEGPHQPRSTHFGLLTDCSKGFTEIWLWSNKVLAKDERLQN